MKPILFNTEMVRAILEGRKTVTRRVIKQPFEIHENGYITKPDNQGRFNPIKPPYTEGDILYVRETWIPWGCTYCERECYGSCNRSKYAYKASGDWDDEGWKWKPSIHMPRKAARIFLRVTGVRVERLQDMSPFDAISEGIKETHNLREVAIPRFRKLWDSTIDKKDIHKYGWEANPYVWEIKFERIEKPEGV